MWWHCQRSRQHTIATNVPCMHHVVRIAYSRQYEVKRNIIYVKFRHGINTHVVDVSAKALFFLFVIWAKNEDEDEDDDNDDDVWIDFLFLSFIISSSFLAIFTGNFFFVKCEKYTVFPHLNNKFLSFMQRFFFFFFLIFYSFCFGFLLLNLWLAGNIIMQRTWKSTYLLSLLLFLFNSVVKLIYTKF